MYYRDEIGNISTSNLWGDSKKVDIVTFDKFLALNTVANICNFFFENDRQNWRLNLGTHCLVAGKLLLPLDMGCHFGTSYLHWMESASLISLLVLLLMSW